MKIALYCDEIGPKSAYTHIIEELLSFYQGADLYTLECRTEDLTGILKNTRIISTGLSRIKKGTIFYRLMSYFRPFLSQSLKLRKEEKYDLIIHISKSFFMLLPKQDKVPVIRYLYNVKTEKKERKNYLNTFFRERFFKEIRQSDLIIASSDFLARKLKKDFSLEVSKVIRPFYLPGHEKRPSELAKNLDNIKLQQNYYFLIKIKGPLSYYEKNLVFSLLNLKIKMKIIYFVEDFSNQAESFCAHHNIEYINYRGINCSEKDDLFKLSLAYFDLNEESFPELTFKIIDEGVTPIILDTELHRELFNNDCVLYLRNFLFFDSHFQSLAIKLLKGENLLQKSKMLAKINEYNSTKFKILLQNKIKKDFCLEYTS